MKVYLVSVERKSDDQHSKIQRHIYADYNDQITGFVSACKFYEMEKGSISRNSDIASIAMCLYEPDPNNELKCTKTLKSLNVVDSEGNYEEIDWFLEDCQVILDEIDDQYSFNKQHKCYTLYSTIVEDKCDSLVEICGVLDLIKRDRGIHTYNLLKDMLAVEGIIF